MSLEEFVKEAKGIPGGTLSVDYQTITYADGSIHGTELLDYSRNGQSVLYNHQVQFDDWREFDAYLLDRKRTILGMIHKPVQWTCKTYHVNSDGSVDVECLQDGQPTQLCYDTIREFDEDPRFR